MAELVTGHYTATWLRNRFTHIEIDVEKGQAWFVDTQGEKLQANPIPIWQELLVHGGISRICDSNLELDEGI